MNIGNIYYIDKRGIDDSFHIILMVVSSIAVIDLYDFWGNKLTSDFREYPPNPDLIDLNSVENDHKCVLLFHSDSRDYPTLVREIKQKFPEYFI